MRLVPRRLLGYAPPAGAEAIRTGAGAAWGPRFGPGRAEGSGGDARHRCVRSRRGLRLLMHGPKKLQGSYA